MHVEKVATRASPKKLEAREHWKRETFAQRRHLMCCMRLRELQTNMDSRPIFCFLCWSWRATNRDEGVFYKWRNSRNSRFQTQRRETAFHDSSMPRLSGGCYDETVPFSVNLCLRPWTNFWVNEENYCVTVCGQSSVTSGENVRLCRFSIDTASLYLNSVFGDICPRLHKIVSLLGALDASRTLFCFVLCEGRRRERKTLL